MASTYPRYGYNNVFESAIQASNEDSDFPVERLINQRITSKYKSGWGVDPIYINSYPVDGQLLVNWYFGNDTAGSSIIPEAWELFNTPSAYNIVAGVGKIGSNAMYLGGAATPAGVSQSVTCPASALGKQVSVGVWVKFEAAKVNVSLTDGTTTWTSANNTVGVAAWEWLSVSSADIASGATELTITLNVIASTGGGYFDGALMVVSDTATQTPHVQTIDYMAMANHNFLTAGLKVTLEKSTDNFTTPVTVQAVTPTEDGTLFKSFTSTSSAYLRLKIEATGTYYQRAEIGIANVGEMLEMPEYISSPYDPLKEKTLVKSATAFTGIKLGVDVRSTSRNLKVVTKWLSRSFLTGADWQAFMDWAVRNRKPFFFAHNEGLYPSEVYYVNVSDSYEFSAPMRARSLVEQVDLTLEGVRL